MKRNQKLIALLVAMLLCITLVTSCKTKAPVVESPTASAPAASQQPSQAPSTQPTPPSQTPPPVITNVVPEEAPKDVKFADDINIVVTTQISAINLYSPGGSNAACQMVYRCIFDRLLEYLGEGKFGPSLAKSYETSDYKTFVFHLRDDVYFSNGDKLTAQDVLNTIQMGKDTKGVLANDYWRGVEAAEAPDAYTVKIVLNNVNVEFLYTMTMPSAGITNQRAIEKDPEKGPWVGTGLFTVDTLAPGDFTKLVRNENYWGKPAPSKSLTFRIVSDTTARAIMMKNGEIQVCLELMPEDRKFFINNPDYSIAPVTNNNIWYISFNMTAPITGDMNFRLALAHGINREEMMLASLGGAAEGIVETTGTIYGYATEFRNEDIPLLPYDLNLAKDYLAKSEYKGEEIEVSFSVDLLSNAVEMLVYQLSQIGIPAKINKMDSAALSNYTFGEVNQSQLVVSTCSPSLTPLNYGAIVGGRGGLNRASYNNPVVNDMLAKGTSITDVKAREAHYRQIQELVSADIPYLSIFYRISNFVLAKGVGGQVFYNDLYHDFRYVYQTLDG